MFASADDKGFCDNTELIIDILNQEQIVNNGLLQDDYKVALNELVDKGLLYRFTGKHNNSVYLIRHWYLHNKYKDHLHTNYYKYLKLVMLEENKYVWKPKEETIIKEDIKLNENKVNEIKLNESEDPFGYDIEKKGGK